MIGAIMEQRNNNDIIPRIVQQRLLFLEEAARYINMHKNMLLKFEKKGWIRPFYFPNCRSKRYDVLDLDRMIERIKNGEITE